MKILDKGTLVLNEVESILYVYGMGLSDLSEFSTKTWLKRGCFKKNHGSHKRHISHLECCACEVVVEGSGVGRSYTLKGIYSAPSKRITKNVSNKGVQHDDVAVINNFILQQLYLIADEEKTISLTKSSLYESIGLFAISKKDLSAFRRALVETYTPHHKDIKVNGMFNLTSEAMSAKVNDAYTYAFNRLQKAGFIKWKYEYFSVLTSEAMYDRQQLLDEDKVDNVHATQPLSDLQLLLIQKAEADLAYKYDITLEKYVSARLLPKFASKAVKEFLPIADQMLKDEFEIKFYFRKMRIDILKPDTDTYVTKKEARKAFIDKTAKLSMTNFSKPAYREATTYGKKFMMLNILLFLQLKGGDALKSEIENELFTLKYRIDDVRSSYVASLKQDIGCSGDSLMTDIERIYDESQLEEALTVLDDYKVGDYTDVDMETGELLYQ